MAVKIGLAGMNAYQPDQIWSTDLTRPGNSITIEGTFSAKGATGTSAGVAAELDYFRNKAAASLSLSESNSRHLYPASYAIWMNAYGIIYGGQDPADTFKMMDECRDRGVTPMIYFEVPAGSNDWNYVHWPNLNAYWDPLFQMFKDWRLSDRGAGLNMQCKPKSSMVLFAVNREFNAWWSAYGVTREDSGDNNRASLFRAAWQHIHGRMRTTFGNTNVKFVYAPYFGEWGGASSMATRAQPTDAYPGDAYVEYMGCDIYNSNFTGDNLNVGDNTMSSKLTDLVTYFGSVGASKGFVFPEIGYANGYAPPQSTAYSANDTARTTWLNDAIESMNSHSRVVGFTYFSVNLGGSAQRWDITDRSTVWNAFATKMNAYPYRHADKTATPY